METSKDIVFKSYSSSEISEVHTTKGVIRIKLPLLYDFWFFSSDAALAEECVASL